MPAQVRSEFLLALNQVASERNISLETIIATIEDALVMAYRKDRSLAGELVDPELYMAEINQESGEAAIFEKNEDGSKGKNVTPPGFGRIAAQTAGQVLRQRIREAEKKAVIEDFSNRIGGISSGIVLRFDGSNVVVELSGVNKAEAIMPPQEQNPAEHYRLNQRLTFYIEGIRETARGQEIIVSRAHKNLVSELFRREVPEIQSGAVEIRILAREPGGRTKLAVVSTQSGVDPVGACVGQKGVRVQAVINELGGLEKVDIIQFTEEAQTLIAASLAPAKDIEVILDEKDHAAMAIVPDDQLSLAIGREGQNVRLAAKLTGWKIDIKGKLEAKGGQIEETISEVEKVEEVKEPVQIEEAEKKDTAVSEQPAPMATIQTDDQTQVATPADEEQPTEEPTAHEEKVEEKAVEVEETEAKAESVES
jgi:N utilization substance protein A